MTSWIKQLSKSRQSNLCRVRSSEIGNEGGNSRSKKLIEEYIQWLNQDLCFQNINDEPDNFPEKYSEPEGAFFIAANGAAYLEKTL